MSTDCFVNKTNISSLKVLLSSASLLSSFRRSLSAILPMYSFLPCLCKCKNCLSSSKTVIAIASSILHALYQTVIQCWQKFHLFTPLSLCHSSFVHFQFTVSFVQFLNIHVCNGVIAL